MRRNLLQRYIFKSWLKLLCRLGWKHFKGSRWKNCFCFLRCIADVESVYLPHLWHYLGICLERRRIASKSLRMVGVPDEVRTEHRQNASRQRYHLSHHAWWGLSDVALCGGRGFATCRSPSVEHCRLSVNGIKKPGRQDVSLMPYKIKL
jgi:hypothetical protein